MGEKKEKFEKLFLYIWCLDHVMACVAKKYGFGKLKLIDRAGKICRDTKLVNCI
jgi:hypothetical protein